MIGVDERIVTRKTAWEVQTRIATLAMEVAKDYEGMDFVLLGLLNGGAPTTVWLGSALYGLGINAKADFLRVESYGTGRESNREPIITANSKLDLSVLHALLIDDVAETSHSMRTAWDWVESKGALSIAALTLVRKIGTQEAVVPVKYVGFEMPPEYFVGSGLDAEELFRFFPGIGAVVKI